MKPVVVVALAALCWSGSAAALCKFKAADGSWTYSHSCARMSGKEINQSASAVIQRNEAAKKADQGVEGRRLRGYEYSSTTHSGMRIPMVEPNKGPPEKEFIPQ